MSIDALIPTIRSETLAYTVLSLATGELSPDRIIILDNGEVSVTAHPVARFALDVAASLTGQIMVVRGNPRLTIGMSRNRLVQLAEADLCLFSDDDCYWTWPALWLLKRELSHTDARFAVPTLLTPNNEAGLPDWFRPDDYDAHEQFTMPTKRNDNRFVSEANGGAMLFHREQYNEDWLINWPEGVGWEDRYLTRKLAAGGRGMIVRRATVWHQIAPGGTNPMRRSTDKTDEYVYRQQEK